MFPKRGSLRLVIYPPSNPDDGWCYEIERCEYGERMSIDWEECSTGHCNGFETLQVTLEIGMSQLKQILVRE